MPDTARSRTGLQASAGTDTINTIDDTMAAAFNKLETDMAIDGQGLFSARPTSTVGTPGKRGRYYFATDTKQLFRDNGTGWDEAAMASQQAWQTATGINGVVVHYFKDTLGNVHLRQELQVVTAPGVPVGTPFVTLASGYRPGTTIYGVAYAIPPAGGATVPAISAAISISTAGVLTNHSGGTLNTPGTYVLVFPPFRAEN